MTKKQRRFKPIITATVDKEVIDKVEERMKKTGQSKSKIVNEALKEYLREF